MRAVLAHRNTSYLSLSVFLSCTLPQSCRTCIGASYLYYPNLSISNQSSITIIIVIIIIIVKQYISRRSFRLRAQIDSEMQMSSGAEDPLSFLKDSLLPSPDS